MENNLKESREDNALLDTYENFLCYIETVLQEELPESTKMKNMSNYKMLLKWNGEENFTKEIFKKFEIVKHARIGFIADSVKELGSKIKSAEIYLVPVFKPNEKGLFMESLFFVKKKDTPGSVKERVKKFMDRIFPVPEPQFHRS